MFYRLGMLAVRWRFAILAAWLVVVLAALPFAPRVPEVLAPGGFGTPDMESARAITALEKGLHTRFTSVLVIFSSPNLTANDPQFQAEATQAVAGLQNWDQVQRIVPFTVAPTQISKDGHDAYTAVFLKTDADNAP